MWGQILFKGVGCRVQGSGLGVPQPKAAETVKRSPGTDMVVSSLSLSMHDPRRPVSLKLRLRPGTDLNSDIDIKIMFSKVDSPEKKQLWTHSKNKTRQKWRVFKEN